MGFRFSARRLCNFQGQVRCDNIFPSRTLNCNSKLLIIKIKLAKESFLLASAFLKVFNSNKKYIFSFYKIKSHVLLSHWRQISIFQLIRKMNSHSKILFLILSAGALQKMYLNVVWWMICLLVNELTKLKGRLMMCWWASLILFHLRHQKTFPKISALFCTWVVWAFGSVFFIISAF